MNQSLFNVITKKNTTPDNFEFKPKSGPANTLIESNPVKITGLSASAPISISSGAEYKIGTGPYKKTPGLVNPGDQVQVRITAGSLANQVVTAILTIGDKPGNFKVTTLPDGSPDDFKLTVRAQQPPVKFPSLTPITFKEIVVAGINTTVNINITGVGAKYKIGNGLYGSAPGKVKVGDKVTVQFTPSSNSKAVTVTLKIGDKTVSFNSKLTAGK